ncbi:MAG TPA: flotillin-like FloA family protein, partial [Gemmatales bacterium]|nr:flotillin-like FloA family protein [Gemmatales bacterium]
VEVGENVGANLQAAQAQADLKVAQAKAEERRAAAVAREQEMRALVEENRAKVVESESQVPQAIAVAIREGKMGVMDFYNMRNIISDTEMRSAIAGTGTGSGQHRSNIT